MPLQSFDCIKIIILSLRGSRSKKVKAKLLFSNGRGRDVYEGNKLNSEPQSVDCSCSFRNTRSLLQVERIASPFIMKILHTISMRSKKIDWLKTSPNNVVSDILSSAIWISNLKIHASAGGQNGKPFLCDSCLRGLLLLALSNRCQFGARLVPNSMPLRRFFRQFYTLS